MKKSLTAILAITMFFSILPVGLLTVSAAKSGDFTYTVAGSQASITKYIGQGGTVSIPSTLGGYSVTGISGVGYYGAFQDCAELTDVTIPIGIKSIGERAFKNCVRLTKVIIPNSVTSIGSLAFENCSRLSRISVPNSVTSVGRGAFNGTYLLENYHGKFVGAGNSILIRYNGDGGKVTIPNGITAIADGVFNENVAIQSVTIPSSVKSIGNLSFAGCKNLTEVIINSGVTQIKYGAFQNCTGLTTVNIPTSVTSIGQNAFNGTPWLQNYSGDFVVVGDQMLIKYKGSEKSVKIPKCVKSIGDYAFSDCKTIKRIAFQKNVASIGDFAFAGCENLATMVIPKNVQTIGESAFYKCKSLTGAINIPNKVTSIGRNAFWDCTGIGSVRISNSVTNIGGFAFRGCTKLTSIGVGKKNGSYSSKNGVLFNKAKTVLIQYPGRKLGAYKIPEGVEVIETWAFSGCSRLKKITIPNSLKEIGWGTFEYCTKLTEVNFPDSFKSIGDSAFLGCTELTAINIPGSVAYIGDFAFKGCTKLAAINVDGSNLYYSSADGVLFNKEMTSIINYPCNKTGEYVIPSGVEHIEGFAFSGINGLTSVTIPSSVKSIGVEAFRFSKNLERVFFFGNAPKMVRESEALDFAQFDDCSPSLKIYFISGNTGFPYLWYGSPTANFGVPVESVLLNTAGIKWPVGKSGTFKVTVTPDYATIKELSWKSTNSKVATVDSSGKVTAVGAGTTTIICTATGGNKTATCRMTVVPNS